jgi:hypothetical protein
MFTASLHINGSYSITACVFVAAGMCLPRCCPVMNVYYDFTIVAFGRHVTLALKVLRLHDETKKKIQFQNQIAEHTEVSRDSIHLSVERISMITILHLSLEN